MTLSQLLITGSLLLAAAVGICLYQLLPWIVCRCNSQLRKLNQPGCLSAFRYEKNAKTQHAGDWLKRYRHKVRHAGYRSHAAVRLCLFLQYIFPVLLAVCVWLGGAKVIQSGALALLLCTLVGSMLQRRVRQNRKAFARSLFRIYRFLNMQISSGIPVSDALKGLHEAVGDPQVQPVFVRFSALYEMTLNFSWAYAVVDESFAGRDSSLLAAQITQALRSGIAGKGMQRLESLYFTRAFALLQQESRNIRAQLTWVVAAGLVPCIVLFLYPILYGALQAVQSIFG